MMKRILFGLATSLALLCPAFAAQMATPTFSQPAGTYINSVFITIQSTTSGYRICYSVNGTTPTAATAGTCDAGFYSSTGAFMQITVSGTQLCAIATEAGFTNSAVACATYTLTPQATTNPLAIFAPVKITSAGANVVDELPKFLTAPNGTMFLFYSEGTTGVSIDAGGPARVMFKTCLSSCAVAANWTAPASTSYCIGGDPANGCLYNLSATGNMASCAGVDYNGKMILLISQWGGTGLAVAEGIVEMTSTNNGNTWSSPVYVTPSGWSANQVVNPTANLVSIPPGSPGVTGSCSTGCIFVNFFGENSPAFPFGMIYSYDEGVTWSTPVNIPNTWPTATEEIAWVWLGGNNLMGFMRPGQNSTTTAGWPVAIMLLYSTNLGATWNSYTYNGSFTEYGAVTNVPLSYCSAPLAGWGDVLTAPSVVIDPQNPNVATLLYGERFVCNGVSINQWQLVSFNTGTAFSTGGQNLPLTQVFAPGYTGTAQPHTTYSNLTTMPGTNSLLMAYEQGSSLSVEDIYIAAISYAPGMQTSGGVKYWSPAIAFQ